MKDRQSCVLYIITPFVIRDKLSGTTQRSCFVPLLTEDRPQTDSSVIRILLLQSSLTQNESGFLFDSGCLLALLFDTEDRGSFEISLDFCQTSRIHITENGHCCENLDSEMYSYSLHNTSIVSVSPKAPGRARCSDESRGWTVEELEFHSFRGPPTLLYNEYHG